ncbi:MAG: hypothetical protein LBM08_13850 [Dysgonamonadaceae bacterium]|nr:hypothetical protein [Dysgonamonadaceae bacterium]
MYIRHAFHSKTKSNDFLLDILKEKYDIELFDFDTYSDDYPVFERLKNNFMWAL